MNHNEGTSTRLVIDTYLAQTCKTSKGENDEQTGHRSPNQNSPREAQFNTDEPASSSSLIKQGGGSSNEKSTSAATPESEGAV